MSKRKREKKKAKVMRHQKPEMRAVGHANPGKTAAQLPALPAPAQTDADRTSQPKRRRSSKQASPELADVPHLQAASPEWKELYAAIAREFHDNRAGGM